MGTGLVFTHYALYGAMLIVKMAKEFKLDRTMMGIIDSNEKYENKIAQLDQGESIFNETYNNKINSLNQQASVSSEKLTGNNPFGAKIEKSEDGAEGLKEKENKAAEEREKKRTDAIAALMREWENFKAKVKLMRDNFLREQKNEETKLTVKKTKLERDIKVLDTMMTGLEKLADNNVQGLAINATVG